MSLKERDVDDIDDVSSLSSEFSVSATVVLVAGAGAKLVWENCINISAGWCCRDTTLEWDFRIVGFAVTEIWEWDCELVIVVGLDGEEVEGALYIRGEGREGLDWDKRRSELPPALIRFQRFAGDTGLVEFCPSEDLREFDGVDRGDCSLLDLEKWSRSTNEEQDDCSIVFFAGFGGDLDVTDY